MGVWIRKKQTRSGASFTPLYRRGGRAWPVEHGGTFKRRKDAEVRAAIIAGELAAGRDPAELLRQLAEPSQRRTLRQWADAYQATRVDLADASGRKLRAVLRKITDALGDRDPAILTPVDVQEWIVGLGMKPTSVGQYAKALRALLDYTGVDPNPARGKGVRLPRVEREQINPPTAAEVETIIATVAKGWRLPLRVLEQTGMRVGELQALEWQDVDEQGSRFRVRAGKTAAARRWVAVPGWLMDEVAATVPREDRTPERRVFVGFRADYAEDRDGPRLHARRARPLPPARPPAPLHQREDARGRARAEHRRAGRSRTVERHPRHLLARADRG
jgi:integrase